MTTTVLPNPQRNLQFLQWITANALHIDQTVAMMINAMFFIRLDTKYYLSSLGVGCWFPRRDMKGFEDVFAAWMLTLLKPWRQISDIASGDTDRLLYDIFLEFECSTLSTNQNIMKNIQYYYECRDSANKWTNEPSNNHLVTLMKNALLKMCISSQFNIWNMIWSMCCNWQWGRARNCTQKLECWLPKKLGFSSRMLKIKLLLPSRNCISRKHWMLYGFGRGGEEHQEIEVSWHHPQHDDSYRKHTFHWLFPEHPKSLCFTDLIESPSLRWLHCRSQIEQRWAHNIVAASLDAHLKGRCIRQMLLELEVQENLPC